MKASSEKDAVARFVRLMVDQDLDGVVALYGPGSTWEVHVPGWDTVLSDPAEMLPLHRDFFGRDHFSVDEHQILGDGGAVALRWNLSWIDRDDGAACTSFQSHFFEIRGSSIHRHRMYCSGVRASEPESEGGA